jgi:hypothetical protein
LTGLSLTAKTVDLQGGVGQPEAAESVPLKRGKMAQGNRDRSYYGEYFREIDVLHGLQSVPEEREWLMAPPRGDVKPAKVVLFLGCNVLRTTHLVRTVVDIFKLLDVDFVAVAGPAYCCGILHHRRGDTEASYSYASATVRHLRKFSPERVVMWCPSCIYFYDEIMQMRGDFFFQHVTEFLAENLDGLNFQPQPPTKAAVHYHTGSPQTDAEARCAFKLLSALPEVSLVDLGVDDRMGRRCAPDVLESLAAHGWEETFGKTFRDAVEAEADTYCTLYHGCQRGLCHHEKDFPFKVENYITLLGRGLGIEHEDLYKKFVMMGNADAVWADASPCAAASGIGPEDARPAIQTSFVDVGFKSPVGR